MIVVTGANGKLGRAVVERLVNFVSPSKIAACVRDPAESQSIACLGVEVRRGDYDHRSSLIDAFRGANRLLIVSASGIDHRTRAQQHRNAIDAALKANVGQIFYTSLLPRNDSVAYVMKAHLETEAYLKASGVTYTVLKNGIYIEAWPRYLGDISDGEAEVPNDGPIAWVSRNDLAEGTARLLAKGGYVNETVTLTGSQVLSLATLTAVISRVQGRPLKLRITSTDEYINDQMAAGKSEEFAERWATTYDALAKSEFAGTDPLLQNLLGRPTLSVADVLASPSGKLIAR